MSLFYSAGLGGSAIPDSQNLHTRLDAGDQSASDGDTINTLIDQTGNGNDLDGGDATYQAGGLNSSPTFDFSATSGQGFNTTNFHKTLQTPYTIYLVYRNDTTNTSLNPQPIAQPGTRNSGVRLYAGGAGVDKITPSDFDTNFGGVDVGATDTNPHVLAGVWDSNGSVVERDDTGAATGAITVASLDGYEVGSDGGGQGVLFDGAISAVYLYDASHGSQTRSDVISYLEGRYDF